MYVILKDNGDRRIQTIKAIRMLTGLGLKEAKELSDKVKGSRYNLSTGDHEIIEGTPQKFYTNASSAAIADAFLSSDAEYEVQLSLNREEIIEVLANLNQGMNVGEAITFIERFA